MDQGKLAADDDVRRIIPELQLEKRVTIRNLLRCESGVRAQFHIMPLAGWDNARLRGNSSRLHRWLAPFRSLLLFRIAGRGLLKLVRKASKKSTNNGGHPNLWVYRPRPRSGGEFFSGV